MNRVLFTKTSEDHKDSSEDLASDGIEPLTTKSRSTSIDSSSDTDMGMMMGDPVTKDELRLPTVPENEDTPKKTFLTPPQLGSPEMHKVASSTSIKLMGVPVTENDPLGKK